MYKWVVVCLVAVAITKWSQNVQATDDLDDEEKRLLQTLEEVLDQDKRTQDDCGTDECFADEEGCRTDCCSELCLDDGECMDACMNGQSLSTRMEEAAQQQERSNDDLRGAVNRKQKKAWFRVPRIPPIRIPPIRIPRIPIPRIPIPRIPIPRIPRIPPIRIPRIRVWGK